MPKAESGSIISARETTPRPTKASDFHSIAVRVRLAHKIEFEVVCAHDAVSEFLLDQSLYRGTVEPDYLIQPIDQWISGNFPAKRAYLN
jgi:hypothetical protein